ncbi:hypothetical protein VTL71DRAFT_1991 [Oculimacula yallundae]|uniref:Uncharacterized protein n=1 Tax=Oculimacula yallundae TaxID=86028 RepID=A0ABR4CDN5_9HELO
MPPIPAHLGTTKIPDAPIFPILHINKSCFQAPQPRESAQQHIGEPLLKVLYGATAADTSYDVGCGSFGREGGLNMTSARSVEFGVSWETTQSLRLLLLRYLLIVVVSIFDEEARFLINTKFQFRS